VSASERKLKPGLGGGENNKGEAMNELTKEQIDAVLIHLEEVEASEKKCRGTLKAWQTMMANPDYDFGELCEEFTKMVNDTIGSA
jgi:hypothetical protein